MNRIIVYVGIALPLSFGLVGTISALDRLRCKVLREGASAWNTHDATGTGLYITDLVYADELAHMFNPGMRPLS